MRNKSTNALERDVFKLMNNSVFGKTMESVDKRVNVKFLHHGIVMVENRGRKIILQDQISKIVLF
jgi:hypothetical protein